VIVAEVQMRRHPPAQRQPLKASAKAVWLG
jgi:hypothetical protein